ncbi:alcohol dehydrogenase catalytic domain-containing protein [Verrucosispora sp. WMMD573]|uniref:alcohol dehydrogenase catalytic domain-containing protein n=1 Tax=Verrucosispora sp. WMMD573 TaxID=3015149 RepID=UPI00248AEA91|nr:alcohol dehydrogenase catalytic domain-containing protein [Verrucosispora sp. WMMD573]WBB54439.1 alcohol dehydrogenase catalytic domain-containing protein [Verrucosispora sp. WMMD573]
MKIRSAVLRHTTSQRPYRDSAPVTVEELTLGAPRPGELLVAVQAAGLCHSDLSVVDGNRVRPLPMALGHEAVGVVARVGPGVTDVSPGDHVVLVFVPSCGRCRQCAAGRAALCARGAAANAAGELLHGPPLLADHTGTPVRHQLGVSAFADHVVVARESAVVIDPDVPFEVAAMFGCAVLTGAGAALHTAAVRPGEAVAVYGLGGVGLSAVMGARLAGADPIVAVDPVPAKREVALQVGATVAVDPADAAALIAGLPEGGVDVAVETAGSAGVLDACLAALVRGGRAVAVGLPHPDSRLGTSALAFAGEGKQLLGSYLGDCVPQRDIPRFLALWRAGRLPVEKLHTATLTLDDINQALDDLADGRAIRQLLRFGASCDSADAATPAKTED